MATKSELYYWLECDECEEKSTAEDDYDAYVDESMAIDQAKESGWEITDQRQLCGDCTKRKRCTWCGDYCEPDADPRCCSQCDCAPAPTEGSDEQAPAVAR